MFIRHSRLILFFTLIITLGAIYFGTKLRFNFDFESYFPTGDKDVEYYKEFRSHFGDDSHYLLIGIQNHEGIYNKAFLEKVDSLTQYLQALDQTESVLSPTNLSEPIFTAMGPVQIPLIHLDEPDRYAADSGKITSPENPFASFFPKGSKDVIVLLSLKEDLSEASGDSLLENINNTLENLSFDEFHVSGKLKVQSAYIDKMKIEMIIFLSASIILVTIFLFAAYRTIWGIVIPLMAVILAIIWTIGLMGLAGQPLDLMTTLLPPIIFIVGMSDIIHLLTKYIDEIKLGKTKQEALTIAYKEIGLATFITSLTTAIGFGTLINSNINPISNFGLYSCIGVFIAFVLAFSFFPAFLIWFNKPFFSVKVSENLFWNKFLHHSFRQIIHYKNQLLITSLVLTAFAAFFTSQISLDSTLLDDIGKNDPISLDSKYLEEKFGGIRSVEIGIEAKQKIVTPEVLTEIEKIETYLKGPYGAVYVSSPTTYIKVLNKALHGGNSDKYKLPQTENEWNKVNKYLPYLEKQKGTNPFIDGQFGRISGRIPDLGHVKVSDLNRDLIHFIETKVDTNLIKYRLTGSAMLIDKNNSILTQNLMKNLFIALLLVGVIMGLVFRSWKMALVAMIPNIIPLLMIGAIMGIFGINLKPSTSIIFSIAFGIAVDDSIHFLSRLKLQLDSGKSFLYALKRTFLGTGKAMIITSLILVSGFLCLILSSFDGTFYTGLLVSLTLVFALAGDLIILPVVLLLLKSFLFGKKK